MLVGGKAYQRDFFIADTSGKAAAMRAYIDGMAPGLASDVRYASRDLPRILRKFLF
ncbi:MAG: hypothetical protein ACJAXK_001278 [Yoonia sp.]|jgi:hypothetical protein